MKIITDIDEVLFNSVKKHVAELAKAGEVLGWQSMPTYEQVCSLGGTHKAYAGYPEYEALNGQMTANYEFNQGLEIIEGAKEGLTALQNKLQFYLTTRPQTVEEITKEELKRAGFPEKPVVCRPENIDRRQTTDWKKTILEQQGDDIVMIDDSVSLHEALKGTPVQSILFAGPITPRGNGEMSWEQIIGKLS